MAIEAIGQGATQGLKETQKLFSMPQETGQASPAQQTASANDGLSLSARSMSVPQDPGLGSELASKVYDAIDKVGVDIGHFEASGNTAVDKAKAAMSPANSAISPSAGPASPVGDQGLEALGKAFDHAVFMASVNQVLSGVSDTSRTLIKQA
ncbi:MAG: hypothetical protein KDJ48_00355 [Nitratireductor sp.]|nr:hypothetical protein [Nitratireductor sp.]